MDMTKSPSSKPTNVLAMISLGLGIASLLGTCLTGVPAVICGHWSLAQIRAEAGAQRGEGLAKAGLVLGYLGIVAGVAGAALFLFGVS
jgi:hypothetical protein